MHAIIKKYTYFVYLGAHDLQLTEPEVLYKK